MSIYVGTSEIKNIYIGGNITDMQGPCPTGFHVPTKDENVALVAAMTALGIDTSNGNCMKTYLKMPFAGRRQYSSAGVDNQGSNAYYWSSTAYSADYAYFLYFNSAGLYPQNGNRRSFGFSVRCFKNSPLQPTSSWTTLFDGSGIAAGAGIFHNTTDGVISISSDGTNWITIADKNLGATTVYNDGDTLSQANCGNYYQRGNNYGFPRTGSVTKSSTQVDASNYGPGNYYNSSTFITRSSSPYDWSSVQNDNLRGGVTGGEKEVKEVYVGTTKVRPAGWQPGANTLVYYDFEHTSGTSETNLAGISSYNGTYQATPTISTLASGKKIFTVNQDNALNTNNKLSTLNYNNATVCVWFNPVSITENFYFGQERWAVQGGTIFCSDYRGSAQVCLGPDANVISVNLNYGNRQNIVITNDGVNSTAYINGVQIGQKAMSTSTGNKYFHVGAINTYAVPSPATAPSNRLGKASFGSVIIENKARTAQETSDYYNSTKGNYGISSLQSISPNVTPNVTLDTPTPGSGTGDVLTI